MITIECHVYKIWIYLYFFFFQKTIMYDIKITVNSIDFKPAVFENVTSYSESLIEFVNEVARQLQWDYTDI